MLKENMDGIKRVYDGFKTHEMPILTYSRCLKYLT